VLQGGGALGAYQAGAYEALAEAGIYPDWIAGISIGAINCAIIGGNPPEARVEKLRGFWECNPWPSSLEWTNGPAGDAARTWLNQLHAGLAVMAGAAGFFAPRYPPPWLHPSGTLNATSFYDTRQLGTHSNDLSTSIVSMQAQSV
jgi:NTE family protein